MTALLTDNLPLLAGAPNGIKKLRELILELAVRGKLVPQDPSDEPASELLKRIAEEKARLVAEGKIRKQKALAEIDDDEKSFELPAGWAWQRFADFALDVSTGPFGSLIHQSDYVDGGIPLVNPSHMIDGRIVADQSVSLSAEMAENLASYRLSAGDMVMARRGEVGRVALVTGAEDGWLCGTGSFVLRFTAEVSRAYVWTLFRCNSVRTYLAGAAVGTTMVNLNHSILLKMPIAVPPLAEQRRIVAKVDELMALCDRLEAQQSDAESAHAQLVQALLDSLTQASDATDFAANWQRLAEHFHTLFTTEPSIDALKQTLLQLAVMGKLMPQESSDEPAGELLKRIAEEKASLIAEGKIRKQKQLAAITEDERLFELPTGWEWSRLGDQVIESGAGWSPSCEPRPRDGNDWGVLKVSAVSWGVYRPEENKALPASLDARPEHEVAEGDFLVSRANTAELVARSVVVDATPSRLMLSDKIVRLKLSNLCDRHYVNLVNSATHARQYYARVAGGTSSSMKNVSREQILSLPIALPPLSEQHRIVAKVDQLMVLCEQLKTRLTEARQLNEQLASTLVERALAGKHSQAPAAPDRKVARIVLAAEITHQLHSQRTFGQRKLQKVVYLAEHAARLAAIQGDYLRDAAGPHDRQLMNQVESELRNRQWYECIDRETVGHAYRPLSQAGQHRADYQSIWSASERAAIEQVIELMRGWDTDRCEMTVTLYAAWNDFILEGRPITDEAIVEEVLHSWNDTKLRFSKAKWLEVLAGMRQHELLIPSGFGRRTTGGMRTLPGFE